VTSKPDFKVMVLLLVFMQLTRDLFAIAKFLFYQTKQCGFPNTGHVHSSGTPAVVPIRYRDSTQ